MGKRASSTNPKDWSSLEEVLEACCKRPTFAGVGFVFTADDPYCGIDLDDVWASDAAEPAPWAERLLERFADTYSEPSPSDTGAKIWCRAKAPRCGSWKVENGRIEIYDRARFFTVTGRVSRAIPRIITDHQRDIERLIANLDGSDERSERALVQPIGAAISKGTRHNKLVSLAGTMWRRGMCAKSIESALLVANEQQCDPPLASNDILEIVRSMQRWPR
jgi:primase-polymerase (primpol)-like protein